MNSFELICHYNNSRTLCRESRHARRHVHVNASKCQFKSPYLEIWTTGRGFFSFVRFPSAGNDKNVYLFFSGKIWVKNIVRLNNAEKFIESFREANLTIPDDVIEKFYHSSLSVSGLQQVKKKRLAQRIRLFIYICFFLFITCRSASA